MEGTEECANASVSILEANVLQKNRDYGQFIEMVESYSPDLVVALETDQGWADTLINSLSDYEYVQSEPLDNTYGMLLLSRIPFVKSETKYRVKDDIPSFDIDIELGGREVSIYVVHPRPPSPSESDSTTQRDAELVMVGREADKNPNPVIVVGDMNDVAWSHTTRLFQRLSGLLDPRKGRGFFNTFDANNILLRYPLDHCFHTDDFMVRQIERGKDINSDHFPMYIELCLKPLEGEQKNQEAEPADEEDVEEGEKTLEKAGVK